MMASRYLFLVSCLVILPALYCLSLRSGERASPLNWVLGGPYAVVTDLDNGKACVYSEARPGTATLPQDCACNFHRLSEIELLCAQEQIADEEKELCENPPCQLCCSLSFNEQATSSNLQCKKKCPNSEIVYDTTNEFAGLLYQQLYTYAQTLIAPSETPTKAPPAEIHQLPPSPASQIENAPMKSVEEELEEAEAKKAQTGIATSQPLKANTTEISEANEKLIESEKPQSGNLSKALPSPFEEGI